MAGAGEGMKLEKAHSSGVAIAQPAAFACILSLYPHRASWNSYYYPAFHDEEIEDHTGIVFAPQQAVRKYYSFVHSSVTYKLLDSAIQTPVYFSLLTAAAAAVAAAKSLQSCPTLCDPRDGSPPGSPVPGILQARTLEWVAISSSKAWEWKVKVKSLSCVQLLVTPWTAAHQAPPSMGFSRQEYWNELPLPSPSIS